jgi:hypothetical protein
MPWEFIGKFLGQRVVHFIVYALIALVTIGIPYKLFFKDTTKTVVRSGGTVINNVGEKEIPIVGCSMYKIRAKVVWQ